jgi:hypothetical protein
LYSCSFVCSREEPEPLAFDELRLLEELDAVRLLDELGLPEPLLRLVAPELRLDELLDDPLELPEDVRPEELRLEELRPDELPERPREPLSEEPPLLDCVRPERLCA